MKSTKAITIRIAVLAGEIDFEGSKEWVLDSISGIIKEEKITLCKCICGQDGMEWKKSLEGVEWINESVHHSSNVRGWSREVLKGAVLLIAIWNGGPGVTSELVRMALDVGLDVRVVNVARREIRKLGDSQMKLQ